MRITKILKNPFLWAFIVGIASLHLIKELALKRRSIPEPMVKVESWALTDQEGRICKKEDFSGKVIIADFFFTSCPSICPKLTNAMKEVHDRFENRGHEVAFMSITVDPSTDTPEVLKRFMRDNGIAHENWYCLTGSKEDIYDVVVNKMRVHMGEKVEVEGAPGIYDIPHLAHLALFDQNGDLRGLFKTDGVELSSLVRAANFLLEKN